MGWKTRKVKKSKPVSTRNSATGSWETTYVDYYADESYFVSDDSSSAANTSTNTYDTGGSFSGGEGC